MCTETFMNCPFLFLLRSEFFFLWSFTNPLITLPNNSHLLHISSPLLWSNYINGCNCDSAHKPPSMANWSGFIHFLIRNGINKICPWIRKWNLCLLHGDNGRVHNCFIWIHIYFWHTLLFMHAFGLTADNKSKYNRGNVYYIENDCYDCYFQIFIIQF